MQHKTPTRSGPRPLWLHLNATVAMMASLSDTKEMFTASSNILCEALHGVEQYHNSPVKPFHRPMTVVAKQPAGAAVATGPNVKNHYISRVGIPL